MVNPIFLILLPLGAAFLSSLFSFSSVFSRVFTLTALILNVLLSFLLVNAPLPISTTIAGFHAPLGIRLLTDSLSVLMLILINSIALLSLIYSFFYIEEDRKTSKYYILFVLLIAGSNGMMITNDIFNLFVFFEIVCLSSYLLVAYFQDKNALEAGLKYLIQGSLGSLLILTGIALIYLNLGTLNLADIADRFQMIPLQMGILIQVFLIVGLGVEAAIFPLNSWLPDAHSSAPSSVSAMLSGFVIEIALLVIFRLIYSVFDGGIFLPVLGGLGVLTLLIGELAAYKQKNIKRALAFSSIGQIGLILFALSLGTRDAVSGGLMQVLNHALSKTALFLAVGFMIKRTGSYDYSDFRGIAAKMPVSALVFTAGALSLIGVPPLFGFFSKIRIVFAAFQTWNFIRLSEIALILTATVVESAYFLKIIALMYEKNETREMKEIKAAPFVPRIVLLSLFAGMLLLFLVLPFIQQHVLQAADHLLARFSLNVVH